MTFACKNYVLEEDRCKRLRCECIPGRPGCVLEGRVALSEALEERIRKLEEERKARRVGKE